MKTCFAIKLSDYHLAIADLIRYNDDGYLITRINVPLGFRGRGFGTELLEQIKAEADREQEKLWLEVSPYGGLNYKQLKAWYRKHGFRGQGHFLKKKA